MSLSGLLERMRQCEPPGGTGHGLADPSYAVLLASPVRPAGAGPSERAACLGIVSCSLGSSISCRFREQNVPGAKRGKPVISEGPARNASD